MYLYVYSLSALFSFSAEASSLDGVWQKECVRGVQREERIENGYARLTEDFYPNLKCEGEASLRLISEGPFVLPGAQQIDFTFHRVLAAPMSERMAEAYNARSTCGFSQWSKGEVQDVTGKLCTLFGAGLASRLPEAGRMIYGIIKQDGELLYFGKLTSERNGSSPSLRPLEFDLVPYLRAAFL